MEFHTVDAGSPEAQHAMAQYFAELDARFTHGFDGASALVDAPLTLNSPAGEFVVARSGDEVVACGGVQFMADGRGEIKRMWVSPDARGRGVGRSMLTELERRVRDAGCRSIVLDTNGVLGEAIAMYTAAGYHAIERYNDNPYAQHWFEKPC